MLKLTLVVCILCVGLTLADKVFDDNVRHAMRFLRRIYTPRSQQSYYGYRRRHEFEVNESMVTMLLRNYCYSLRMMRPGQVFDFCYDANLLSRVVTRACQLLLR